MLANILYLAALATFSPVIAYRMIRHGRYRRGVAQKLWGVSRQHATILTGDHPCIWIHAVSVGEVNLLGGLVDQLRQASPDTVMVISTSTDTGFDLAVKKFGDDRVFFCPLDFTWAVKRTLRNLSPNKLVLTELELWPNLVRLADDHGCRVSVINARLSQRTAGGYQRFDRFTRSTFQRLDWVGCQDEAIASRFEACGTPAERLQVTGSLKFDDAPISRDNAEVHSRSQWAGVDPWHRVWLVGSTQRGEEEMAIKIYRGLLADHPELRLILVPRHVERFESVAKLIEASGLKMHRKSRDKSLHDTTWDSELVVLVDTIGELRHWWGVCQIATVGGSFSDRGGQNMLEPAGYGCAVSFGPDTRNFDEIAKCLLQAGGAIRVQDSRELEAFVRRCLEDIPAADSLGRSARAVVQAHRGATDQTVAAILEKTQTPNRIAA